MVASALQLAGRVALITGGGTGIGRAIAETFAREGAAVAITGRRPEVLDEAVATIRAAGGQALAIAGDVARPEDGARMVAETVAAFGALHVLVNNAGIARGGPLDALSAADVDALVDVDLKGPIHLTRAALPHLRQHREAGGAVVINISSSVTQIAVKNYSVYSAAKAGLDQLTRCWALDWGGDRIRVNAICPGVVDTPILGTLMPAPVLREKLQHIARATPLGRVGQADDVARVALFLAGPLSAWVTGAVIPVDGGLSLGQDQ